MKKLLIVSACCLLLGARAWADDFTVGDWIWNVDDSSSHYAATANSAGQILAQFCYPEQGSCVYTVGFDTECTEGKSYPALVNTDQSAASITLTCGKSLKDGGNLMLVEDFDQIDTILRKASRVGIALPMQGDEFKAVRFSLKGSVAALDAMRKFAANATSQNPGVRKAKDTEVF